MPFRALRGNKKQSVTHKWMWYKQQEPSQFTENTELKWKTTQSTMENQWNCLTGAAGGTRIRGWFSDGVVWNGIAQWDQISSTRGGTTRIVWWERADCFSLPTGPRHQASLASYYSDHCNEDSRWKQAELNSTIRGTSGLCKPFCLSPHVVLSGTVPSTKQSILKTITELKQPYYTNVQIIFLPGLQ